MYSRRNSSRNPYHLALDVISSLPNIQQITSNKEERKNIHGQLSRVSSKEAMRLEESTQQAVESHSSVTSQPNLSTVPANPLHSLPEQSDRKRRMSSSTVDVNMTDNLINTREGPLKACREQQYLPQGPFLIKYGPDMSKFKLPPTQRRNNFLQQDKNQHRDGFSDDELQISGQHNSKQAQAIPGVKPLPLFYRSKKGIQRR